MGSFIYGLAGDTPKTIRTLYRASFELGLDMAFFIPLTPLPGTPAWRRALWDPTGTAFRAFDFLPHVNGNPAMNRLTRALYRCFAVSWPAERFRWLARGFFDRNPRRRSIIRRHAARGFAFAARGLLETLPSMGGARDAMRLPPWYDD